MLRLYYAALAIGLALVWIAGRDTIFLFVNEHMNPAMDALMRTWTLLGDGWTSVIVAALFLLVRFRIAIFLALSYLSSGLLVQILKRYVFSDNPRPLKYFGDAGVDINLVEGVKVHMAHSFPSGHTASAFALFIGMAFFTQNKYLKAVCLLLALGVGYSRVYLALHFPEDVLAGSLIGVLCALLLYQWVAGWKKDAPDMGLINLFRRK
jgi:membrane-associated phospholipid phosphatase